MIPFLLNDEFLPEPLQLESGSNKLLLSLSNKPLNAWTGVPNDISFQYAHQHSLEHIVRPADMSFVLFDSLLLYYVYWTWIELDIICFRIIALELSLKLLVQAALHRQLTL